MNLLQTGKSCRRIKKSQDISKNTLKLSFCLGYILQHLIYIYIYIYIYAYIYVYIHVCIYIYVYLYMVIAKKSSFSILRHLRVVNAEFLKQRFDGCLFKFHFICTIFSLFTIYIIHITLYNFR